MRFECARKTYAQAAKVQATMRARLLALLGEFGGTFSGGEILELGCGDGELAVELQKCYDFTHYDAIDLVDFSSAFGKLNGVNFICADFVDFVANSAQKYDLIISNAALQWCNQAEILPCLAQRLNPDGLLVFSTFGERNFCEVKARFNVGLEYLKLAEIKEILSWNCTLLHASECEYLLEFATMKDLLMHLKRTGVNSLSPHFRLRKSDLAEQNVKLTYHALFFVAKMISKPTPRS